MHSLMAFSSEELLYFILQISFFCALVLSSLNSRYIDMKLIGGSIYTIMNSFVLFHGTYPQRQFML